MKAIKALVLAGGLALGAGAAVATMKSGERPTARRMVQNGGAAKLAIGAKVPAFTLKDAGGKETPVKWDAGETKATVLVFVSTRCPVSNAYNERLAALDKELAGKNVQMFGLNANAAETPAQIKAHAEKNNWTFPVLHDAGNKIADATEAKVTPEAYVVDRAGTLVYWGRVDDSPEPGGVQSRDLALALDAVAAGQPVKNARTNAFGCSIKRAE